MFACGFALGIVRNLWLVPHIGPLASVAVELPFILCASWVIAGGIVNAFAIHSHARALGTGVLALAVLLLLELTLTLAFGGSGKDWLISLARPEGLLGLAGQGVFALLPVLVVNQERRG